MFSELRADTRAPAEAHNGAAAAATVIQRTPGTGSRHHAGHHTKLPNGRPTASQATQTRKQPRVRKHLRASMLPSWRRVYAEVKRRLSVERERSWH